MIRNGKSGFVTSAAGVIGTLVVAAALYSGLSIGPDMPAIDAAGPAVQEPLDTGDSQTEPGVRMPSAKEYVEIVRRPIFSPNRRPAQQGEIVLQTVAFELNLKLVGIIISSGVPIAIVSPNNNAPFVRLTEGDSYQGWTVTGIEPQRVTLRRNEAVEYLELDYDQPPARKPATAKSREGQQAKQKQKSKEKE